MTHFQPKLLISEHDENMFNVLNVLYENRYCNQDDFSILVCGGRTLDRGALNDVYELKGPTFKSSKFPSMLEARESCRTAVINSNYFVVGGFNESLRSMHSIEHINSNTNSWVYRTKFPGKRYGFFQTKLVRYRSKL